MKKRTWIICGLAIAMVLILIYFVITMSVRLWLFSNCHEVFNEWNELLNEYKDDFPEEKFPFPVNYYMNSVFEVYAVKQFRIRDDMGTITENQLYSQFQDFIEIANRRLDGNPTKIYVGHNPPDNITPKYFWAKPMNFFFNLFSKFDKEDERVWYVVIYKKARTPFRL